MPLAFWIGLSHLTQWLMFATSIGGKPPDAGTCAIRPAQLAQLDSNVGFYEELDMKTDLNHSHQVRTRTHRNAGSVAPPDVEQSTSRTRYTCQMHPEMVRDMPGRCPECGMMMIPMRQAIARVLMELRSLSAVNIALRLNRV